MKISVIIPTYNEAQVIGECLLSLAKQSIKDFEVIVVDDGSTDDTLTVITKLQVSYKLHVTRQKHQGPGVARNLGAKQAKGQILVFVDADMIFGKDFLRFLVKPIIEGKYKGVFSKEEYVSNWDNVWAKCWNFNEGWEHKKRHPKNYPDKQKVFRAILKSEFNKVGGFNKGGYTDDYTLYAKLGYMAESAPGAIFYHKNPSNLFDVFHQAKWVAKREYKFDIIGKIIALFRSSLPVSIIIGIDKSISNRTPGFLVFKVIYDSGIFLGILENLLTGKVYK
ncbi:hypothetical protein A3A76_03625 [Candidatus Woesebacteria bacterium RIFCSPLOWO2_01_FULL_39_23]|uniref:Glycosyltransferase 2-like domain-containing protein n=1 Tax=Candidatus Woesebacteria bacterium RIFCSPHIGHO2_01_FULL_40_22 TaxID=1802499 RepID=A0A1F7YJL5_9BACT|nr:MAG: hypothetical protein A2141_00400 [Candidatus Woesebacteria bacterium RBG_16_40_11]OGM27544.1 MAG: hypothetical protein A2628_02025 [Candidatus Woesebacteria bacterium RIFCSPHIGHO2_01_FULL_40_22]OGM36136.1 MAG: hypothetical protein A3E41_02265 [Candidatus Woesebacteria bacterium RIFCSPHIGHO2_12_FULL_38_9]OGM62718.1 MAG: hypothetical protein A3A76_03625 [Candidatus Woesebacteria bacterium RIFCSPLOWO2_01_FULL_39_23]